MSMGSMPCSSSVGHVLRLVAAGEDAAVHRGVERLDAAVQHLREAGDCR